jgi:maltooligosyltrehalose trehalohydrolase
VTKGWQVSRASGDAAGLRVWAPIASRVDAVLYRDDATTETDRLSMRPGPSAGWWETEAGARTYAFSLDGGPPRPDPRSQSQPFGIDGPSRLVDHEAFEWGDAERRWRGLDLAGAVVYELHVGTFSSEGTFDGVASHLGHLVDLGIDAIELCPVAEFSGDHGWGYDGVDLFAPHHAYGGPDGLKRLIRASHEAGIAVVLDVVYNHLGPAGNYLSEFGPYFTPAHTTNWGEAVNFDGPGSDEVRRFVLDNAAMWFGDYHVDGLRLDAVHAIADDSAVHILEDLAGLTETFGRRLHKPLFLVAESDRNDPRYVRSREANGLGMHAAWADEFHHALHAVLTGERTGYYEDFGSLAHLAKACRQAWVYAGDYSPHRRRRHGRPPDGLAAQRFVTFLQNHDQVGNRAKGERIAELAGIEAAKIGACLTLLSPFVPMLFQGEEWAASAPFQYFTDHRDPELGRKVSEGRREEFADFGWGPDEVPDPQDPATFEHSRLDWDELGELPHREVLEWYQALIALRRDRHELADTRLAETTTAFDEDAGWLVVERGSRQAGGGSLVVAANFSDQAATIPLGDVTAPESGTAPGAAPAAAPATAAARGAGSAWTVLLSSSGRPEQQARPTEDGKLELAPQSVAVLSRTEQGAR